MSEGSVQIQLPFFGPNGKFSEGSTNPSPVTTAHVCKAGHLLEFFSGTPGQSFLGPLLVGVLTPLLPGRKLQGYSLIRIFGRRVCKGSEVVVFLPRPLTGCAGAFC